jgi:hypothetical protein
VHYAEDGQQMWVNRFNSSGSSSDAAYDINVIDGDPMVYCGGVLNNNYGIIGITDSRANDNFSNEGLSTNYPNPFNPETKISFSLKSNSIVKLVIYDALGKEVAQLVYGKYEKGTHNVTWNASAYTSGVYFYRIETSLGSETRKIVLIK